ncbi:hypothetical protein DFH09DRAFT_1356537 [Mycena vulgaris]|nr:hypothetical protein DFH09DRAFT_1356537 [Mycena vulgaris]
MSDNTASILLNWATLIPNGLLITVTVSGLITTILVVRFALPARMIKSLDASLHNVERMYFETFGIDPVTRPTRKSKFDMDFASRLIVLQDNAARLRMQTLFHGTFFVQWGELWGLCTGHSFAIWRCTRKIECLNNEMQMRWQERLRELNRELTVGTSPTWQLTMRQRHDCRSFSYDVAACAGCSGHLSC